MVTNSSQFSATDANSSRGTPLDAPLYEIDPERGGEYWGCKAVTAIFTVDGQIADIIPDGLRLAGDPPLGMVLIAEYGASTLGTYSEFTSFVQVVDEEGAMGMYVPYIYVTNDAAMAAGREVLGAPKKLASIELSMTYDTVQGTMERPDRKRLATLTMKPGARVEPGLIETVMAPGTPLYSLRHLPAPPGGVLVHELVRWHSEIALHRDSRGFEVAFTGPASLTYDSHSAIDPVHRLGVGNLIAAVYMEFDMSLHGAEVVHTHGQVVQDAMGVVAG
jgi:acetoacetate decarboxylase